MPAIRQALRDTKALVAAVSPIVGGAPVAGPAGVLMESQGLPVSITGVAQAYRDFLDLLVVDLRDESAAEHLRTLGVRVQCTNTIMRTAEDKAQLARAVVSFISKESAARAGGVKQQ